MHIVLEQLVIRVLEMAFFFKTDWIVNVISVFMLIISSFSTLPLNRTFELCSIWLMCCVGMYR